MQELQRLEGKVAELLSQHKKLQAQLQQLQQAYDKSLAREDVLKVQLDFTEKQLLASSLGNTSNNAETKDIIKSQLQQVIVEIDQLLKQLHASG